MQIISGDQAGVLRIWPLLGWSCERILEGHTGPVRAVTMWGSCATSCSQDETIRVWNLATGAVKAQLVGHSCDVRSVSTSADGRVAVSCGFEGPLRIWDLQEGQETGTIVSGHADKVNGNRHKSARPYLTLFHDCAVPITP
jgi:eukaryotic-like serine/threonine-protein kinase